MHDGLERIIAAMEELAPPALAEPWDNVGLVLEGTRAVHKVLLALDVEYEKIKEDYLETNTTNIPRAKQFYEQIRKEMDEETAKSYYQAFIADERYLEAAFRSMGENYINNVLKIDKEKIKAFRKKVLI